MKKILIIFFILFSLIGCIERESNLKKVTGVSVEKEEEMKKIFKECGFEKEILHIQHDSTLDNLYGEGNKGYKIDYNGYILEVLLFLKPDGSVSVIKWGTKHFYINGEKKDNIRHYFMTNEEENDYIAYSKKVITEGLLKSPSSAKFPTVSHWTVKKEKGNVIIKSYVEAQNSYGVMIKSNFQIKMDFETYYIFSLIFDGKETVR